MNPAGIRRYKAKSFDKGESNIHALSHIVEESDAHPEAAMSLDTHIHPVDPVGGLVFKY